MLQGRRILFVDGGEQLFRGSVEALKLHGAVSAEVESPEDALTLLRQESFDLLVISLRLPGMGAYQFCKELENSPGLVHVPVVPACTNPFVNSINISACPNVVDLLRIPFTPDDFVNVLTRILSGNAPVAGRRRPGENGAEER